MGSACDVVISVECQSENGVRVGPTAVRTIELAVYNACSRLVY